MKIKCDQVLFAYARLLTNYPHVVLLVSAFLSFLASGLIAYFGNFSLARPELGFETRGTKWSGRVLANFRLDQEFAKNAFTDKPLFTREAATRIAPRRFDGRRKKREEDWTEKFQQAILSNPCTQFQNSTAQDYIVDVAQHMSQVVVEFSRWDQLFELGTVRELCYFQKNLSATGLKAFSHLTDFKHFYSFPNIATCMTTDRLNCEFLTQDDLNTIRKTVDYCRNHTRGIVSCAKYRSSSTDSELRDACAKVPAACNSSVIQELFYFLLSNQFVTAEGPKKGPFHLNAILPIFTYRTYIWQDRYVPLKTFLDLYETIQDLGEKLHHTKLRGIFLNIKYNLFDLTLKSDIRWGILAFILITVLILIYSMSIYFAVIVGVTLALSIVLSFGIYKFVFGIQFFPFINLLGLVLLVGIGADDTFILNFIFARAAEADKGGQLKRDTSQPNGVARDHSTPTSCSKRSKGARVGVEAVHSALSHATLSMFVTSVTTSAAFFANLVSNVLVIKCFGVFAGTLILVHYLLVVSLLPAAILCKYHYINPACRSVAQYLRDCYLGWLARVLDFLAMNVCPVERLLSPIFDKFLPWLVRHGKFFIIVIVVNLMIGSLVVIFYSPGFGLPEKNPLQLFKSSHPFEWYDNNVPSLFPFRATASINRVYFKVIWGIEPRTVGVTRFDPLSYGDPLATDFRWDSVSAIESFGKLCPLIHAQSFVTQEKHVHDECWTSRYFRWASRWRCQEGPLNRGQKLCCNHHHALFNETDLPECLRVASRYLSHYWDGPVFRKGEVVAYIQEVEAAQRYTAVYKDLDKMYKSAEEGVQRVVSNTSLSLPSPFREAWITTSLNYTTVWYDLLNSITQGTPVSVGVSVAVALGVVVLSTRTLVLSLLSIVTISAVILFTLASLVLLEWRLNIVEATITILTVGLSFDFTLHYAVAFKLSPSDASLRDRVRFAFHFIGVPVLLSALTTFLAGLAMFPSASQAFFQIGAFMMLVTGASWVLSTLFFMSLLEVFGPRQPGCCSAICGPKKVVQDERGSRDVNRLGASKSLYEGELRKLDIFSPRRNSVEPPDSSQPPRTFLALTQT